MCRATSPVLLNVTDWDTLVTPTRGSPKDSESRITTATGTEPLPTKATAESGSSRSLEMVKVPLRSPVALGANVTVVTQLSPAATTPKQLSVWANSPLVEIPKICSVALPLLVSVRLCELVEPTACTPKSSVVADTVAAGA